MRERAKEEPTEEPPKVSKGPPTRNELSGYRTVQILDFCTTTRTFQASISLVSMEAESLEWAQGIISYTEVTPAWLHAAKSTASRTQQAG